MCTLHVSLKQVISQTRVLCLVAACAMKALNSKGIVHRDLKPGNILLSHSGKPNPAPTEITLKIGKYDHFKSKFVYKIMYYDCEQ